MTPLKLLLSNVYWVAVDPTSLVISHWSGNGWNLKLPWEFQENLIGQVGDLLSVLPKSFLVSKGARLFGSGILCILS